MKKAGAAIAARPELAGMALSHRPGPRDPLYVDVKAYEQYLGALSSSYQDIVGRPAELISIGGTTFAKAFQRAVTFGAIDPAEGEPELAHQTDERLALASIDRNLRIYALALARLVSADPEL
jgi:succinyl-diaminopimelate desuccinylase